MHSTTSADQALSPPAPPNAVKGRWSLALRLTIQLALAALLMVGIASVVLNLALMNSLRHEQDQFLNNKLRILQKQLAAQPRVLDDLKAEVEEDFTPHEFAQVYARVMDNRQHLLAESPTMSALLPPSAFPSAVDVNGTELVGIDFRTPEGREFRWIAGRTGATERDGVIQVALDNTRGSEMLNRYRGQLAAMVGAAAIASLLLGFLISRRALQPLRSISETVARIQPTTLGQRIDLHGLPSELYEVAGRLNGMLDRLEQSFSRLTQFSVDLAHELRTPLNNLLGLMETSLQSDRPPAEYRETLASALEESVRLHRIIDGLLFIARSDDPRTQIRRETIDVSMELRRLTEMYQILAADRGAHLTLQCASDLCADLDKTLLQRAVDNLVANAMDHTPAGGQVAIHATYDGEMLQIEVRDTGCGISADELPRVFDRLYRGEQKTPIEDRGLGLGLSIVRGIMSLHGGSVDLRSKPGEGTSVCLKFPRRFPSAVMQEQ
jgi:two-component system, OmpR family, heavy metal sensor histidine kinase CusS